MQEIYNISEFLYIYVPSEPVASYIFVEESNKLRAKIGMFTNKNFFKYLNTYNKRHTANFFELLNKCIQIFYSFCFVYDELITYKFDVRKPYPFQKIQ